MVCGCHVSLGSVTRNDLLPTLSEQTQLVDRLEWVGMPSSGSVEAVIRIEIPTNVSKQLDTGHSMFPM